MAVGQEHYDDLELRDPEIREDAENAALSRQIAHAKKNAPYFTELLKDVDPDAVNSRAALAQLPVTRKSDLAAQQKRQPPFGGMTTVPVGNLRHVFMSPGPLYEPDSGEGKDFWRFGRAMWAAGIRPGDLIHNSFSYHLVPAGILTESGASAIGCPVIPAGVGNTELQAQAMSELGADAYCGTPSFLRILTDRADEMGLDISKMRKGLVGAEPLFPAVRKMLSDRGIEVFNSYGTADLGLIAYETVADQGMMIDEGIIVELVEPLGEKPVADGEIGEIVVTSFNPIYPLIRFATGDLSQRMTGASPCGRTNMRIRGWMGRADQSCKVKGMFVHASGVGAVVARHDEVKKARLVVDNVDGIDVMTLKCEADSAGDGLVVAIKETIQSVLKVRGEVSIVASGSLPDDGKAIDDIRKFD